MYIEKKRLQTDLNIFLTIIGALIIIGFLFIYSASSVFALEKFGSAHYFIKKHFIGLLLGLIGLLFARFIPLDIVKHWSPFGFFFSLGLTSLTLIPLLSHRIHGSSRWLHLGFISLQPSELLKISLLIYLAYFFSKKEKVPASFINWYLPFFCIIGSASIILLKQPDFGMTVTLLITSFILLFIMHFNIKHFTLIIGSLIPLLTLLIYMRPYRWKRILTFLNPWNDPHGSGFQIIQSLIAIGSGGLWGIGVSHSKQKFFYLPMQHTDFIFSIIAEETGFIGTSLLISLYLLFLYFGIRIAWYLKDTFSSLLTLGFVILTSVQAFINLAVATGLVPTKGIGLPFISGGNSAFICSLFFIGLIMNCVHES